MRHWAVVVALLIPAAALAAPDGAFGLGAGTESYTGGAINNVYTTLAADASAASTTISVASTSGLVVGDIVMMWQPAGGSVDSGGTSMLIAGTSIGQWELARITAINGTTLSIETNTSGAALSHSYTAARTQVVRVPQYGAMNISGTVSAPPWNPTTHTGGIVAFLAKGVVAVNGTLSADGAGGVGGVPTAFDYDGTSACGSKDVTTASTGQGQTRGEGAAGNSDKTNNTSLGFGNVGNGGGAGNCQQNGGGGGANAGVGGIGGTGPINGEKFAGNGGAAIDYSSVSMTQQMVFGGGGGAGNQSFLSATAGRNGGGVIWFRALGLVGSGTISASGSRAGSANFQDGQGGGGGGGSIYIRVAGDATLCGSGLIAANGSDGIDGPAPSPAPAGAGGGGGGGRIFIQDSSGTCVLGVHVTVTGGNAGTEALGRGAPGSDGSQEVPPPGPYCSTDGALAVSCPPSVPACLATSNSCVQCVDDSTCLSSPDTVCDTTRHDCVQCLADGNCPATAPVCNTTFETCGAKCDTINGYDCSRYAADPYCATSGAQKGQCVQCLTSSVCPNSAPVCNTGSDSCEGCTSNTDCAGRTPATLCMNPGAGTGQCVQCLSNADCSGTTPYCNGGTCAACNVGSPSAQTADLRCTGAGAPICQADGSCGACTTAAQCQTRSASTPLCMSGACAACSSNAQCDAAYPAQPVCSGGACVPCASNADCSVDPLRPACSAGVCVRCDQVANGESTVCAPLSKHCEDSSASSLHGACVDCRDDADCSPATPMCASATATCMAVAPDMAMSPPDLAAAPTTDDLSLADDLATAAGAPDQATTSAGGGGCSCDMGGRARAPSWGMLLLLALALLRPRRRRADH